MSFPSPVSSPICRGSSVIGAIKKISTLSSIFVTATLLAGCSLFPGTLGMGGGNADPEALKRARSAPLAELAIPKPIPEPAPSEVTLASARFNDLPNWQTDRADQALLAFQSSCRSVSRKPTDHPLGKTTLGGKAGDWRRACDAAKRLPQDITTDAARRFFEQHFEPFKIEGHGTFTGYFEATLDGSYSRSADFPVPIYKLPTAAKGWMSAPGKGPDRRLLESGAVTGLEPLIYLRDHSDAFTLHVQGSGLITLPDGRQVRLGYAGNNGHKFGSIMNEMIDRGYDASVRGKTWQAMTGWLKEHPRHAAEVLNANPRYIFFTPSDPRAATGAQGQPLTAGRSMAVDPAHIPLGVPLFIDTKMIYRGKTLPLQRLMVAQDTGNAIKGPVRGDVYWGTGPGALELAGKMKEQGRYFILLPKNQTVTTGLQARAPLPN